MGSHIAIFWSTNTFRKQKRNKEEFKNTRAGF